ncbi:PAS domain-containing protein [Pseudothioclava arenosa]|uniref:PAS domain-containing protein n=1 Tax=Pseudothioclava arenosa TaxID=1795308 RepID=A0A2A4CRJ3_9RHOB|nr:PAS domain-containing protein [Pseudothioclava arenosa]PCD76908.1 PAS domain-containing protein [Pseudothioclava arenosa]
MERETEPRDEVIALRAPAPQARQVLSELRGYWEGLRNGRLVPARADVDPRGIERALEYAFVLERVAPGMGRFRLSGMHLNDLMGMEVRGMPLTALFTAPARQRIAELTETMFHDPAVVEITLRAEAGIGKPPLGAKLLMLPLTSDLGDISRALGCLIAEGAIGRAPRRFEVAGAEVAPILQDLPMQRGTRPEPQAPNPTLVATPESSALQALSPEERRAMFRIVKTGA